MYASARLTANLLNYRFLADRFVEGTCPKCGYDDARGDQCDNCTNPLDPFELIDPRCKLCSDKPVIRDTKHLAIALDKLQEKISAWVDSSSKKGEWSTNTVGMTQGWLKEGLKPRMVTRDLSWGVPVPLEGWENKVMYVWVSDASMLCKQDRLVFTSTTLPVRCTVRLSKYHSMLHKRLATMVAKS